MIKKTIKAGLRYKKYKTKSLSSLMICTVHSVERKSLCLEEDHSITDIKCSMNTKSHIIYEKAYENIQLCVTDL